LLVCEALIALYRNILARGERNQPIDFLKASNETGESALFALSAEQVIEAEAPFSLLGFPWHTGKPSLDKEIQHGPYL
jgi:hypothetical protein